MDTKTVGAGIALIALMMSSTLAVEIPPAIKMFAWQTSDRPFTGLSYSITVPARPTSSGSSAVEMYAGLVTYDNKTALRTILAYGCYVNLTEGCHKENGSYRDGYIAYLSIINLETKNRFNLPSGGVEVSVGDILTYEILAVAPCTGELKNAWMLTASNATGSYSVKFCDSNPWINGRSFTSAYSGILELHSVDICAELPVDNAVMKNIRVRKNGEWIYGSWVSQLFPDSIDCSYGHEFNGNDVRMTWMP